MWKVRDPRIEPIVQRTPELRRIRALLGGEPGRLDGKTFDQVREAIGEPAVPDGTLHQALLDEGLEVEDG